MAVEVFDIAPFLSKEGEDHYRDFLRTLDMRENNTPYLAVLGVNSARLSQGLIAALQHRFPNIVWERSLSPRAENIKAILQSWSATNVPLLLDCWQTQSPDYSLLAGQLLLHRDAFFRQRIPAFILCDEELYRRFQTHAFDFIFASTFSDFFSDHAAWLESAIEQQDSDEIRRLKKEYEHLKEVYEGQLAKLDASASNQHLQMRAAYRLARAAAALAHWQEAEAVGQRALELAKMLEARHDIMLILELLGDVDFQLGNNDKALVHFQALQYSSSDQEGQARALLKVAKALYGNNELDLAMEKLEQALQQAQETTLSKELTARVLVNKGAILDEWRKDDEALASYQEALAIFKITGSVRGKATCLTNIGFLLQRKGDFATAEELLLKALKLERRLASVVGEAICMVNLGMLYRDLEDIRQAEKYLGRAKQIFIDHDQVYHQQFVTFLLENLEEKGLYPSFPAFLREMQK